MTEETTSQIEKNFHGAVSFLKKTRTKNYKNPQTLYSLPWYLVVGPSNSGKSSLLSRSGLKFILAKYNYEKDKRRVLRSRACDWWVTHRAVILDVAGRMISSNDNESQKTWAELLELTKNNLPAQNFSGVIVVLNLETMMLQSEEERQQESAQIQERIHQVKEMYGRTTPVSLVINKCDLLKGFVEYFSDLDQADRQQAWGFPLGKGESNIAAYNEKFDDLLQRLHERLIWRLHHERNSAKRVVIKQFPLQFESIKTLLSDYINFGLIDGPTGFRRLQGVFFTSSVQEGVPVDRLIKSLAKTVEPQALVPKTTLGLFRKKQSYFTKDLFSSYLLRRRRQATQREKAASSWRPFAYVALVLIVVLCGSSWTYGFKQRLDQISAAQNAIQSYQMLNHQLNPKSVSVDQYLPSLNELHDGLVSLRQINKSKWWMLGLPQNKKLANLTLQTYEKALVTDFLPRVQYLIGQQIKSYEVKNEPAKLYAALRAYLMLSEQQHLNQKTLVAWITNECKHNPHANQKDLQRLVQHLQFAIQANLLSSDSDKALVVQARASLQQLQPAQLASAILQTQPELQNQSSLQIASDSQVFKNAAITIPFLYTKQGYTQSVQPAINRVVDTVLTGNWVLGKNLSAEASWQERGKIEQALTNTYFKHYVKLWDQAVAQIQFEKVVDGKQLVQLLTQTLQKHQLAGLLKTIDNNTSFLQQDGLQTSAVLNNLNHFTETRLQTALTELTNLTNYMRSVQQADDPGQKAFELAKQRMESSAVDPISKLNQLQKNAPAPLQSWLTNVAQNSWSILLQQAHSYINSAWQSGVIPQYNAVIANRYPVDKTAAQDIQLKDFVNFFGPNGVMQSFFTQFLSPFVNTDNAPWALRVKNGVSLPIAQGVLKQFERAVLIRHMFFNGNQKIAMQFALVPVAFKRDDQAVSLVVNGQKSQFVMNSNKPQTYNWPGNANLTQTILSFLNTKGQTYTETKSGPWALFRLLSESSLSQTTDSKEFEVVFDYKGNAAKFKLYADNNINPFIPGIVDQFRCPVII